MEVHKFYLRVRGKDGRWSSDYFQGEAVRREDARKVMAEFMNSQHGAGNWQEEG